MYHTAAPSWCSRGCGLPGPGCCISRFGRKVRDTHRPPPTPGGSDPREGPAQQRERQSILTRTEGNGKRFLGSLCVLVSGLAGRDTQARDAVRCHQAVQTERTSPEQRTVHLPRESRTFRTLAGLQCWGVWFPEDAIKLFVLVVKIFALCSGNGNIFSHQDGEINTKEGRSVSGSQTQEWCSPPSGERAPPPAPSPPPVS